MLTWYIMRIKVLDRSHHKSHHKLLRIIIWIIIVIICFLSPFISTSTYSPQKDFQVSLVSLLCSLLLWLKLMILYLKWLPRLGRVGGRKLWKRINTARVSVSFSHSSLNRKTRRNKYSLFSHWSWSSSSSLLSFFESNCYLIIKYTLQENKYHWMT